MLITKERFHETKSILGFHGFQSFKEREKNIFSEVLENEKD